MDKASLNTYLLRVFCPRNGGGVDALLECQIYRQDFAPKNVGRTNKGKLDENYLNSPVLACFGLQVWVLKRQKVGVQ